MRPFIASLVSVFLLTGILCSSAIAQADTPFDEKKMTIYLQKLADKNKMMGSLAIDSAGKEVYQQSVGYKKISEEPVEADANTAYRTGSVTKIFTATLIFQLIEQNQLTLETSLSTFYPDLPQADDITIEHLLRHQSGLYNFSSGPDYPDWRTEYRTKKQMLQLFKSQESDFSPGSESRYSNTNYVILGYIIEELSGDSYANQLKQNIVEPLALKKTYYGDTIDSGDEAVSYEYDNSKWTSVQETDMSIPHAAGAIVSTPGELTDFIRALFKGDLISTGSLEKMMSIQQGFGMGLIRIPFYEKVAYGYNGGIDGFQAHLSYFPEEDMAVAFTSNGFNYAMNEFLIGVLSIGFGKEYEIPSLDTKTLALNTEQQEQFVGQYVSEQLPMDIEIFIEDSVLKAQATGQSAFPLKATNETTLGFEQAGLIMEFDSLQNNKHRQFILRQNGGSFQYERK